MILLRCILTLFYQHVSALVMSHLQVDYFFFVCFWRGSPLVGHGLLIHEVSRSHTTTHHSR